MAIFHRSPTEASSSKNHHVRRLYSSSRQPEIGNGLDSATRRNTKTSGKRRWRQKLSELVLVCRALKTCTDSIWFVSKPKALFWQRVRLAGWALAEAGGEAIACVSLRGCASGESSRGCLV